LSAYAILGLYRIARPKEASLVLRRFKDFGNASVLREEGVPPLHLAKVNSGLRLKITRSMLLVWENRAVFEAWTKSEAFRAAHSRAGDNKPLYLDHQQFEGFGVPIFLL
jgi:heme-degrading monooxygenase HmoA